MPRYAVYVDLTTKPKMVSGCGHRKEMAFGMPFQSKRYIYDMESMGQCAGDKMLFARA